MSHLEGVHGEEEKVPFGSDPLGTDVGAQLAGGPEDGSLDGHTLPGLEVGSGLLTERGFGLAATHQ